MHYSAYFFLLLSYLYAMVARNVVKELLNVQNLTNVLALQVCSNY